MSDCRMSARLSKVLSALRDAIDSTVNVRAPIGWRPTAALARKLKVRAVACANARFVVPSARTAAVVVHW